MSAPSLSAADAIARPFLDSVADPDLHDQVAAQPEPTVRYLVAITPRSGSSYLCDVMRQARRLGRPNELLSAESLPRLRLRTHASDPDDHLSQVLKLTGTANGVAGLKASWFQFNNYCRAMRDPTVFHSFRFIYLTRRDRAAQAVSLYCATQTDVFHTNIEHGEDKWAKLQRLDYDFDLIRHWWSHIVAQEVGWCRYFEQHQLHPLTLDYEDVQTDVVDATRRIARFLGRPQAAALAKADSLHRKISDARSVDWTQRFVGDLAAWQARDAAAQA